MPEADRRLALDPVTYRRADRLTKLGGVALVALGLEAGGDTVAGVALGLAGAALAVSTVFVEPATDHSEVTDE